MMDVGSVANALTKDEKKKAADILGLTESDASPQETKAPDQKPKSDANPAPAAQKAMGLKESDASPGKGAAGMETKPLASTDASKAALGLGETDIAPETGAPPPVPQVPVPVIGAKPVEMATKALPPVDAAGPKPETEPMKPLIGPGGVITAPPSSEEQNAVIEEIKKEPSIGDQILQLAKDTGRSVLELIQGFAKGYSGSDIPLASQVRQAEKMVKGQQQATAEQAQKDRDFQAARDRANQDFQMQISKIQQDYENRRFAATTQAERDAADRQRDFEGKQAQQNRDAQLKIATMQTTFSQQGRQMSREQQAADAIKSAIAGLK